MKSHWARRQERAGRQIMQAATKCPAATSIWRPLAAGPSASRIGARRRVARLAPARCALAGCPP
eukprot:4311254-Pyramimonas_sp.AAC.1